MKMFIAPIIIIVFWAVFYVTIVKGSYRHKVTEDGTFKAWHIQLPGYGSYRECESTVKLKPWLGTKIGSISAVKENGEECPEVNAGIALITAGAYEDHTIKQNDAGEWILYKPGKVVKYFTWSAFYRIRPWRKTHN